MAMISLASYKYLLMCFLSMKKCMSLALKFLSILLYKESFYKQYRTPGGKEGQWSPISFREKETFRAWILKVLGASLQTPVVWLLHFQ